MSSKVEDWTVLSMLEWATEYFQEKGIPDPRHSIEWLLAETLGIQRLDLYLKYDRPLSSSELSTLRPLVKRRAKHEPLQYIIGFTDFMNARISVTEDVLIPRLETEQLVEIILDHHPDESDSLAVLDIGTGSGCIPIALKMERPEWQVSGMDLSQKALEIARANARQNEVEVAFTEGDILSPGVMHIDQPLDIIVSNPPYIKPEEKDTLEPQVREYEPDLALYSEDLEKMYGNIIRFSEKNLVESGALFLELHENYSEQIFALFKTDKWTANIRKDYDQKPRFIIAQRR
ncbi:MAG TPA: peptide chain release factor N(5)-glutamine methyltransferase [Balneolaceae bacterium]|nr:peptide chain release factor N(5)-glutamine methyltransferase [Balneolaceae bacterium]